MSIITRINESGYRQYSSNGDEWKYTHRRVAEKKIGRPIGADEHVHHINKDKTDNRPSNLVIINSDIHRHLHKSHYNEKNACFRCGRTSHFANDCYARTDVYGRRI